MGTGVCMYVWVLFLALMTNKQAHSNEVLFVLINWSWLKSNLGLFPLFWQTAVEPPDSVAILNGYRTLFRAIVKYESRKVWVWSAEGV